MKDADPSGYLYMHMRDDIDENMANYSIQYQCFVHTPLHFYFAEAILVLFF